MAWLEENGAICRENYQVKSYDCTPRRQMSITALLRGAAELADLHLGMFDLSYEQLAGMGVAFLLAGVEVRIARMPAMRERVILSTWHRGVERVRFLRDVELCDPQGNRLAAYSSQWVLVDPESHKIKRPSCLPELERVPMGPLEPLNPVHPLRLPENMTLVGERRVGYSDLDYNGHLNNTKYADIISDWVPGGLEKGCFTRLRLDFQGEARLGETLKIFTSTDGERRYVSAVHGRGKCFSALCEVGCTMPPKQSKSICFT